MKTGAGQTLESPPPLPNLQALIDRGIEAGEKTIVVPPGRYQVKPVNRQHLVLKDLQDVTIIADGVEMVCTQTTRALTISNCRNLKLVGLTIDYDPLPFTQGRIVRMSADKKVHDIELFDGYPDSGEVKAFKYEIFQPDTRTLRSKDYYDYAVEPTRPRAFRLTKKSGSEQDAEQLGDLIVIGTEYAPDGSSPHAILVDQCERVRLERISLFASNCFGFFETDCDGMTYDRCVIDRRAASDDPIRRGDARLRSLNADAYHSKHARRGPSLLSCVARFQGDDCVNICGNYHLITASRGRELRVLAKDKIFGTGETVEIVTYEGKRLPDAKVLSIVPDGKINSAERAFLLQQHMAEGLKKRWDADAFRITIDRDVDLPVGSLICSTERVGNGFLVKGCEFGFNRSRGVLIKASQGEVIDNILTGNRGPAILVSPEYWWLEAGSANNVVVRGNKITDCRSTGILVTAEGGNGHVAPPGAHNFISVIDNTLSDGSPPNIRVTSTDHLKIFGNTILPPVVPTDTQVPQASRKSVVLEECTNVIESPAAFPVTIQP